MRLLRRGVIPLQGQVPPLAERAVLRALRIPHVQRIEEIQERGVRDAIRLALDRALGMATFEAVFRVARVVGRTETAVLVEGAPPTLLQAPSLLRLLDRAVEVAFVAVTLGATWDDALDALAARGEPAEAWFLDALGVLFVDRAARAVEDRVAQDMARGGLARTSRYRPGYGDWPLEAQAELCDFVEATRIGLHTNEAMALLPRKAVTGVLGFRPAEGPDRSSTSPNQGKEGA